MTTFRLTENEHHAIRAIVTRGMQCARWYYIRGLYAGQPIATAKTVDDIGTTQRRMLISRETWAGGVWFGSSGMWLDFYHPDGRNYNGPLTIVSVNPECFEVVVSGNASDLLNLKNGALLYAA